MTYEPIRIGTRGSPLALKQTDLFLTQLKQQFPNDDAVQNAVITSIVTTGDRVQNRRLSEVGGKGLFAKEIEKALLENEVDCAVHSLKDMETTPLPGLVVPAVLRRDDPRDVFVSNEGYTLQNIPNGAVIGTSSVRRSAILKHHRPDLSIVLLRGNVPTRLEKMKNGDCEATVIAAAGLKRLGLLSPTMQILPEKIMLPAVCQGIIAIQCREEDNRMRTLLNAINHHETSYCAQAERALLEELDGTCHTPIGSHAILNDQGELYLRGLMLAPDGSDCVEGSVTGLCKDAKNLGILLGQMLKERAGENYLAWRG